MFFWILVIDKLGINVEGRELMFKDRDGATIDLDDLPLIIKQYKSCSCFFIEFCFDETEATSQVNLKKVSTNHLIPLVFYYQRSITGIRVLLKKW